jgi:hypothetical protein
MLCDNLDHSTHNVDLSTSKNFFRPTIAGVDYFDLRRINLKLHTAGPRLRTRRVWRSNVTDFGISWKRPGCRGTMPTEISEAPARSFSGRSRRNFTGSKGTSGATNPPLGLGVGGVVCPQWGPEFLGGKIRLWDTGWSAIETIAREHGALGPEFKFGVSPPGVEPSGGHDPPKFVKKSVTFRVFSKSYQASSMIFGM